LRRNVSHAIAIMPSIILAIIVQCGLINGSITAGGLFIKIRVISGTSGQRNRAADLAINFTITKLKIC